MVDPVGLGLGLALGVEAEEDRHGPVAVLVVRAIPRGGSGPPGAWLQNLVAAVAFRPAPPSGRVELGGSPKPWVSIERPGRRGRGASGWSQGGPIPQLQGSSGT